MSNKPETVYGKPIDVYFAELADRIDAATASNIDNICKAAIEAIAFLAHVGETGDGRLHLGDIVNIDYVKARLQTVIVYCEMRPMVRNGDSALQSVNNMAAMRGALRLIKQMGIDLRNVVSLLDRKDGRREQCLKTSIEIYQTAERALFEPPRNCDLFATVKDAAIEFSKLRNNPHPCPDFIFSEWLLAPATKGGAA